MNLFIPSHSRWLLPISMLVTPFALGVEAPKDNAAPPAVAGSAQAEVQAAPAKQRAYLGLVSGHIPELLSTHLGVRDGEGVLVRSVMPNGPAANAGIGKHDLIITIDGKPALSPAEVQETILSHQPGDKVKIGLIQAGKGTELEVTLGKRPDAMAGMNRDRMAELQRLDGMPEDMANRIRDMIEGNMMQFNLGDGVDLGADGDLKQLRERMKEMRKQHHLQLQGGNINMNNATIRLMDDKGSVELNSNNGENTLIVRDKNNKIEWQGPWTTDKDKAAAPEGIRERAGKLNFDMNGIQLKGNGGALELEINPGR